MRLSYKNAILRVSYCTFASLVVLKRELTPSHRSFFPKMPRYSTSTKKYQLQTFRKVAETQESSQNSVEALLRDLIAFSPSKGLCLKQIAFTIILLL